MRRKLSIILCVTLLASNISVAKITSYAAETQDVKVEEDTLEETQKETTEDAEIADLEEKNATSETDDLKAERGFHANSWRFSDGKLVTSQASKARAGSADAWNKVNGKYVNSRGEVIEGAEKKGIDVSQWQGKINWEKVKADGIEFALIRCGYGMDQTDQDDENWEYNVSECERLGIPYGVYIYSYATTTERASSEASHVLRLLEGHTPTYPVYIDMEDNSTQNLGETLLGNIAKTFCDKIAASGYCPGVYANLNWWNNYLTSSAFSNNSWSKWVAQYNYQCDYQSSYDIWQCTDSGSVDGIEGNVDLDFWMGESPENTSVEVEDSNIITYSSYMQTYGWLEEVNNGYISGKTGLSKRLEAFKINIGDGYGDLGVKYCSLVQDSGWQDYVSEGEESGTTGKSKAIQAIRMELTGTEADQYDIYYRVHAQSYGWLDWSMNGEPAGTNGYDKRLEAIQIAVVKKGTEAPGEMEKPYVTKELEVKYASYISGEDWQEAVVNGDTSGTTGRSKAIEGIKIQVDGTLYTGTVKYQTYVQNYGWLDEVNGYEAGGLPGQGKRMEAIKIGLSGDMANKYDIYYRVHAQSYGWLDWSMNGKPAGTNGYDKRLEAIQIVLVEKNGSAPGSTENAYIQSKISYSTHVQSDGWQSAVYEGEVGGTEGKAKRLEAIKILLQGPASEEDITYSVHVQSYGWMDEVNGGEIAGTTGEAKRLEAIKIGLSGDMANKYDIYYRVHAQTYGWMDWAKNGEPAGTEGLSKRLEAIQIVLVEKHGAAPGNTDKAFIKK